MSERGEIIGEAPPAVETSTVIELPAPRPRRKSSTRRRAENPRIAQIHLRTRPAVKEQVAAAAKAARMSITDYLLRNEAGSGAQRQAPVSSGDPLMLAKILGELGKIGSNHNQLAHAYNSTGETPGRVMWERQDRAIQEVRAALLMALGR